MATRRLDRQIRELAEARGFKVEWPWQRAPWDCGANVHPAGSGGAEGWAEARRLRKELIAEITAGKGVSVVDTPQPVAPRRTTRSRRSKLPKPSVLFRT